MLSFELPPLRVTLTSAHHLDKVNSGQNMSNNQCDYASLSIFVGDSPATMLFHQWISHLA